MSSRQPIHRGSPVALPGTLPANRVLVGDCLERLAQLPSASVDLVSALKVGAMPKQKLYDWVKGVV